LISDASSIRQDEKPEMPSSISSKSWVDDHLDTVFSFLRHELGNPVNSLKVTLEVLIRNYEYFDDSKRIDFLRRAQDQVSRQQHLLDAMKRFTRCATADIRSIPFQSVWQKMQHDIRLRCMENRIELKLPPEPGTIWVRSDNEALRQVFAAVVDNAVEALANRRQPKLQIETRQAGSFWKISFRDNGGGIRPEHLPKVYIPLFTTKEGATGLGLPVAIRILQKMNAWMEIETDSKRYTAVTIVLKLAESGGGFRR